MSSTLISDYFGCGTHAARPASLSLASGCCGLYYETDTNAVFAWNGSAWISVISGSGPSGPSVVQYAATAGNVGPVVLPAAPTEGNLLVAIGGDWSSCPINGSGWTEIFNSAASWDGVGIGYKIAGASESATQTPTTDTSAGCISVFEVSEGNPGLWSHTVDEISSSITQAVITTAPAQLCVGICDRQSTTYGVPSSIGTGVTMLDTVSGTGDHGTRDVTLFTFAPAIAGSNNAVLNYAGSGHSMIAVIVVG